MIVEARPSIDDKTMPADTNRKDGLTDDLFRHPNNTCH
jgi:hypothetical protein